MRSLLALRALALCAHAAHAERVVRFTPATTRMIGSSCCAPSTTQLQECYAVVLYVFGQQSAEWARRGSPCFMDASCWGLVVEQAAPRQVSSKAICPPYPAPDSLPYPDSLSGRIGFLVTRNAAGGHCWGARIRLP